MGPVLSFLGITDISAHGLPIFRGSKVTGQTTAASFRVGITVWRFVTEFCAAESEVLLTDLVCFPGALTMADIKLKDDEAPLMTTQPAWR